jgi:hypothetical protein
MSKKSGLFYAMFAWFSAMFAGNYVYKDHSSGSSKYQPKAFQGGGDTVISSYGKKPYYPPLHPERNKAKAEKQWMKQYDLGLRGLFWDKATGKVYWKTHQLAVDHQ